MACCFSAWYSKRDELLYGNSNKVISDGKSYSSIYLLSAEDIYNIWYTRAYIKKELEGCGYCCCTCVNPCYVDEKVRELKKAALSQGVELRVKVESNKIKLFEFDIDGREDNTVSELGCDDDVKKRNERMPRYDAGVSSCEMVLNEQDYKQFEGGLSTLNRQVSWPMNAIDTKNCACLIENGRIPCKMAYHSHIGDIQGFNEDVYDCATCIPNFIFGIFISATYNRCMVRDFEDTQRNGTEYKIHEACGSIIHYRLNPKYGHYVDLPKLSKEDKENFKLVVEGIVRESRL
jgi:hypothetical protein